MYDGTGGVGLLLQLNCNDLSSWKVISIQYNNLTMYSYQHTTSVHQSITSLALQKLGDWLRFNGLAIPTSRRRERDLFFFCLHQILHRLLNHRFDTIDPLPESTILCHRQFAVVICCCNSVAWSSLFYNSKSSNNLSQITAIYHGFFCNEE